MGEAVDDQAKRSCTTCVLHMQDSLGTRYTKRHERSHVEPPCKHYVRPIREDVIQECADGLSDLASHQISDKTWGVRRDGTHGKVRVRLRIIGAERQPRSPNREGPLSSRSTPLSPFYRS